MRRTGFALWACATLSALALLAPSAAAAGDPYFDRQWGLVKVGADRAWEAGRGAGITIAVLDTGVDVDHEDLRDNIVGGRDFVGGGSDASDRNGHGTFVAGIAAAVAGNGLGIAGVAPEAKIMPVRVLGADGRGSASVIDAGIRWAVDNGAHIVNLSLSAGALVEIVTGGSLAASVNYAWSKGVIPVVAAGNDGLFRSEFRNARAMVVTATTRDDRLASYAADVRFADWGIAAPGGSSSGGEENLVFSTYWTSDGSNKYVYAAGTSAAAPHVAGAAAVLRGLGLSPAETVQRLLATARSSGPALGAGRLDVAAAVEGLGPPPAVPVFTADSQPINEEPTAPQAPAPDEPPPTARPATPPSAPSPSPATPDEAAEPPDEILSIGDFAAEEDSTGRNVPLTAVAAGSVLAASAAGLWATIARRRLL